MASNFPLTLDTVTSVAASINEGAESTQSKLVTLGLSADPNVVQCKVWGDIDPENPANSDYGINVGDAPWIAYQESFQVVLDPLDEGVRTLHVRVRDDLDNEADASDSIILDTEAVVAPPAPRRIAPNYPQPTAKPRRHQADRIITSRTVIRIRVRTRVIPRAPRITTSIPFQVQFESARRHTPRIGVTPRLRLDARSKPPLTQTGIEVAAVEAIDRTDVGPEILAAMELLDVI
jgi:hypothetical protein